MKTCEFHKKRGEHLKCKEQQLENKLGRKPYGDVKKTRITISIDSALLSKIDTQAGPGGRSAAIEKALKNF